MLFKRQLAQNTRGGAMMRARIKAKLSREELAARSGLCLTSIGRWERDETVPTLSGLELAADALGISIDEYVGHEVKRHE